METSLILLIHICKIISFLTIKMNNYINWLKTHKEEIDVITSKSIDQQLSSQQIINELNILSNKINKDITFYNLSMQLKNKYFNKKSNEIQFQHKMYNDTTKTPSCSLDESQELKKILSDDIVFGSIQNSPMINSSSPMLSYHYSQSPKMTFML